MLPYRGDRLTVDYYPQFLCTDASIQLFYYLENSLPWNSKTRRTSVSYGDTGLSYELNIRGQHIVLKVKPWSEIPILEQTGAKYNYCVIQRYPNGSASIGPHRDKEMEPGSNKKIKFISNEKYCYTRLNSRKFVRIKSTNE